MFEQFLLALVLELRLLLDQGVGAGDGQVEQTLVVLLDRKEFGAQVVVDLDVVVYGYITALLFMFRQHDSPAMNF